MKLLMVILVLAAAVNAKADFVCRNKDASVVFTHWSLIVQTPVQPRMGDSRPVLTLVGQPSSGVGPYEFDNFQAENKTLNYGEETYDKKTLLKISLGSIISEDEAGGGYGRCVAGSATYFQGRKIKVNAKIKSALMGGEKSLVLDCTLINVANANGCTP